MSEPNKTRRLTISLSEGLIDMVDKAAREDFTTRSDIIRVALLWYLRPQGRELAQTDPDTILKMLQHRNIRTNLKATLKKSAS